MKKTISILMAVFLLFGMFSVGVSAVEEPTCTMEHTFSIDRSNPPAAAQKVRKSVFEKVNLQAEDPNTPFTYYTALNTNAKAMYNAVATVQNLENSFTVTLPTPITFVGAFDTDGTVLMSDADYETYMNTVYSAFTAVIFDHPEQFWINSFGTMEQMTYVERGDGSYNFTINAVEIAMGIPAGYTTWTAVKQAYTSMMNAAKAVSAEGDTRFDKLKTLHDWVANATTYDNDFKDTAYYATSVFLAPHQSVCEGYSEAFKILCDLAGIPCIIAVSADHEWNHVKMDDGKWYAVDVTWDDQDEANVLLYDYFLVGAKTQDVYFDNTTFESEHPYTGNLYADYCAACPALSATAYLPMFLNGNSGASVDRTAKTVYLYDNETVEHALVAAPGTSIRVSADGAQISIVKNGTTVDTYAIVRPVVGEPGSGDVNGDGKINAIDARWILQSASGERTLTAEQRARADVNGDGKINAIDARWILQIASGERTAA